MVRILHDDWPIRLGENTPDQTLKHLADMLKEVEERRTFAFQKSLVRQSFSTYVCIGMQLLS